MTTEETKGSLFEQHFATVAIGLILASILFVGNAILDQGKEQTKMSGTMDVMNVEIKHLKDLVSKVANGRYTKQQAETDKKIMEERCNNTRQKVVTLEERVRDLEVKVEKSHP